MRLTKMLGLAMVAAVAAMSFVGVGAASASTANTALCSKAELVCPAFSTYGAGTVLKSSLKSGTSAVLSGTVFVTCKTSTVEGETTTGLGTTVLGSIYASTFTNCDTCKEVISLTSKGAPWVAHLKNTGGLKGTLTVLKPVVHLIDCTFLQVDCTVSADEVVLDADTSVSPPVVKAVNEPLKAVGRFGCGGTAIWNAEYVLTAPSPLLIES